VERTQLDKILAELKVQPQDLDDNAAGRKELGKLAKARYLVLGSVSAAGGLTVNARLVDVDSGLVVQTATVAAATPDALVQALPDMATMLMMTDEQKLAYEKEMAEKAVPLEPVKVAELPPPPEVPEPPQVPPAPEVPEPPQVPQDDEALPADMPLN